MNYFIANWKANKNVHEAIEWHRTFSERLQREHSILELLRNNSIEIIICPPLPYLFFTKQFIKDFPNIYTGVQNISSFTSGSFTGEVSAYMLKGSVNYAIIGHSERRIKMNEDEEMISAKMKALSEANIKTILCVRDENDTLYESAFMVAFEPVSAIGSGHNFQPADVIEVKKKLSLQPGQPFLYGGSANAQNTQDYMNTNQVDGFLVGTASQHPDDFIELILKSF